MKYRFNLIYRCFLFLTVAIFMACNENTIIEKFEVKAPVITDFSPKTGEVGTEITIVGENLERIDKILIGGGKADIKYRISSTKLVAKVLTSSRNGVITVTNIAGEAQSSDSFSITYVVPTIETYPTEGTVDNEIVIDGTNLHTIDSIMLGIQKATIVSKRNDEIVFKVPYSESEDPVELRFVYFDGTQNVNLGPTGKTFSIIKESPQIFDFPSSLTKYEPIEIVGERLQLIDSIFVGDVKALIKSKTDRSIIIDMPANYFGGNMSSVTLKGIYYGERVIIITNNFQVYADPNEPRYHKYTNVLLSARAGYGGTEDAFFDAETGAVYNSCAAFEYRLEIDFFIYDQSGYVQLYGPHNAANTVRNFRCNGVTIDPQDGSWNDFYGAGGVETRFKALSRENADELRVINAYETNLIVEMNDAFFEGIEPPLISAPRIYRSASDPGYNASSGHFSLDENNIGWIRNYKTGKNGIIKLTGMPKDAVNGRIPELTFDIIWDK